MKHSLLVISSYPPQGITHHKAVVGVATYTKNTLTSLAKSDQDLSITVLAEKLPSSPDYQDGQIGVKRIWKRNSLPSQLSILQHILFSNDKTLLLELELAMFGGPLQLLFTPLFLIAAKIKGMQITTVLHQVITSASDVHGQLNLPEHSPLTAVYTFLLKLFYQIILTMTNKTIVFDLYLKEELAKITDAKKVVVIPHGVEDLDFLDQKSARKKLGIPSDRPVLLYFGYLAWYKGTDSLLDAFEKIPEDRRPHLIIAGGPNPNHLKKPFYKKYLKMVKEKADRTGAIITGFVEEEDIPRYFAASDVCILPYRTFMSSSGPLSFVISAQKPFLISRALSPLFKTRDIKDLIEKEGIDKSSLIFDPEHLGDSVTALLKNRVLKDSVSSLEKTLKKRRSWGTIGSRYYEEIFS